MKFSLILAFAGLTVAAPAAVKETEPASHDGNILSMLIGTLPYNTKSQATTVSDAPERSSDLKYSFKRRAAPVDGNSSAPATATFVVTSTQVATASPTTTTKTSIITSTTSSATPTTSATPDESDSDSEAEVDVSLDADLEDFLNEYVFSMIARLEDAPCPYEKVFEDLNATAIHQAIVTERLEDYDAEACAIICNDHRACKAFGIYAERVPSCTNCSNPESDDTYMCELYNTLLEPSIVTNASNVQSIGGQQFTHAIRGSNGYNKFSQITTVTVTAPASAGVSTVYRTNIVTSIARPSTVTSVVISGPVSTSTVHHNMTTTVVSHHTVTSTTTSTKTGTFLLKSTTTHLASGPTRTVTSIVTSSASPKTVSRTATITASSPRATTTKTTSSTTVTSTAWNTWNPMSPSTSTSYVIKTEAAETAVVTKTVTEILKRAPNAIKTLAQAVPTSSSHVTETEVVIETAVVTKTATAAPTQTETAEPVDDSESSDEEVDIVTQTATTTVSLTTSTVVVTATPTQTETAEPVDDSESSDEEVEIVKRAPNPIRIVTKTVKQTVHTTVGLSTSTVLATAAPTARFVVATDADGNELKPTKIQAASDRIGEHTPIATYATDSDSEYDDYSDWESWWV